jgi:hypothetical protein
MPLPKTCEPHPVSTDSELSKPMNKKTTTGKKTFRTISTEHIHQALNVYLRGLMMIEKNEEVVMFGMNPMTKSYEIKVEKIHD